MPWHPTAKIALELVRVAGDGSASVEHWMAATTYYSQVWMVKCEVQAQRRMRSMVTSTDAGTSSSAVAKASSAMPSPPQGKTAQ